MTVPRTTRLAACLVLLLITFSVAAAADSIEGHWEGVIEIPGTKLGVDIDFESIDGAWKGDISIPLQNAKDLPLSDISVEGDAIRFVISGVPGTPTFEGTQDGSSIKGTFTQGGQSFPFSLEGAAPPAESALDSLDGFDEFVSEALEAWNAPGLAMGIVMDGELIYAKGFGFRDIEKKLPVTPDTLFAIGSTTKAFTTFTLGTLADEGKLEWDQPLREYIPEFRLKDPVASEAITPRDLVTHRSGLPRHDLLWYNNNRWSRAELVRRLRFLDASAQLREKWQYNNLMFLTAGYLVERLTDKSWEDAVRERIFVPLGMDRSNFSVENSKSTSDFALPYRENDDDQLEEIPFRNIDAIGPAGSINSSVNDMAKWVSVHLSGGKVDGKQIINPSTLADMHTPHMVTGARAERPEILPVGYGLGWGVASYRGHRFVSHGGGIDGFITSVTLLPDDGLAVVAFTNSGNPLPSLMTRHAVDRILGLDPIDWNGEALANNEKGEELEEGSKQQKFAARVENTKPSHSLADYAGAYIHPGYGELDIARDGKTLTVTYNDITTPLEHWHYDVFSGMKADDPTFEDMKFMFRMDLDGNLASVEAGMDPFVDPIVFEKSPDAKLSDPAYLERLTGEYVLGPQTLTFSVKGTALNLDIPGQPTYELEPAISGRFKLKILQGYSIEFKFDGEGKAIEAVLHQPDGVYTAKRNED